jgi:hypothetical protein
MFWEPKATLPDAHVPDALHIERAFQRRAMAADCIGLVDYQTYDTIRQTLMNARVEESFRADFKPPSWADILRTDQLISREIARTCLPTGIRPVGSDNPIATAIPKVLAMGQIQDCLRSRQMVVQTISVDNDDVPYGTPAASASSQPAAGRGKNRNKNRTQKTQDTKQQLDTAKQELAKALQQLKRGGGTT